MSVAVRTSLGLAQDHRIEAAGDPKRMARGSPAFEAIDVGLQVFDLRLAGLSQPCQGLWPLDLIACTINFGSVAGGQNSHLFVRRKTAAQAL